MRRLRMNGEPPIIHTDPPRHEWSALIARRWGAIDAPARALRGELGLPTDRPIVMSGHQASFWHGGIVAKVFAADAEARAAGAASAWVVVDQDEAEYATLRAPIRDGRQRLHAQELKLCEPPAVGVASGSLPAFEPRALRPSGATFALPSVSWGAASITESLLSRRTELTAARQVAHAAFDLLESHVKRPTLVFATALASTGSFRALIERLAREPDAAIAAYNDAVASHPEAGLTPMAIDSSRDRWELPLWRLAPGQPRRRVWSNELAADGFDRLAPRALLLTGFMRLGACDLFIHGTGGAIYDRATEDWLSRWLGASLAPTVLASADLRLPFDESLAVPADAVRAVWRAHRARHDPALVGRDDLVPRKRALVDAVRAAREQGSDARPAYLEMHRMLETYRDQERGRLGDLRDEAEKQRAILASREVALDRTWPFPFHRAETLAALRDLCVDRR